MADLQSPPEPSSVPGRATAEQGVVLLEGPQGAIATLTPEAAVATGENLRRAALVAQEQRQEAQSRPSVVALRPAGDGT